MTRADLRKRVEHDRFGLAPHLPADRFVRQKLVIPVALAFPATPLIDHPTASDHHEPGRLDVVATHMAPHRLDEHAGGDVFGDGTTAEPSLDERQHDRPGIGEQHLHRWPGGGFFENLHHKVHHPSMPRFVLRELTQNDPIRRDDGKIRSLRRPVPARYTQPVDLSIIIPAHNEATHLGEQLDALEAETWDGEWEVVVVDNRSTDSTADIVRARMATWPRLRLVQAMERGDKAYALNSGVATTDAAMIAFTDADDIVASGWVAAMATGLQQHDFVTGPLGLDRLNEPWLAKSRGLSVLENVSWFEGLFPFGSGNNYGVTRATWEAIGPVPEGSYPTDDMEVGLRAHRAGIELVGVPEALVHYRYRTNARLMWKQGTGYGKARCRIVRELIDNGEQRPGRFPGWRSWVWLVTRIPTLATRSGRIVWTWVAANRWGQVVGSVQHRILYL